MEERWMPVLGWEGVYEVSDRGRVKSCARVITRVRRGHQTIPEKILKTPIGTHGYPRVNLCRDNRITQYLVHRLVLEAFVGPEPVGMETLHRNGDPTDSRLENLHWGTSHENKLDIRRHGHRLGGIKQTHCNQGHPFDEANTYVHGQGRHCKTCRNAYARRRRAEANALRRDKPRDAVLVTTAAARTDGTGSRGGLGRSDSN